ncbi:MAG: diacylglycerol kinase [Pseudomonadota bacterium]
MAPANKNGIKRIYNAFFYSMAGICAAWKSEAAFRQELIAAIILIPVAFLLGQNPTQVVLLILPIFVVLIVELINSAIEATVDRISDEQHPLSKQAKDIASAAVFMSLVLFALTWGIVLLEKLIL